MLSLTPVWVSGCGCVPDENGATEPTREAIKQAAQSTAWEDSRDTVEMEAKQQKSCWLQS
jgi:hypothetical protein